MSFFRKFFLIFFLNFKICGVTRKLKGSERVESHLAFYPCPALFHEYGLSLRGVLLGLKEMDIPVAKGEKPSLLLSHCRYIYAAALIIPLIFSYSASLLGVRRHTTFSPLFLSIFSLSRESRSRIHSFSARKREVWNKGAHTYSLDG